MRLGSFQAGLRNQLKSSNAAVVTSILANRYTTLRNAAVAAARRNDAVLYFAGAPSDLPGFVFQDSTGVTPATGTDPIGLLLDRSYGTGNLGAELVVNGSMGSGTTNWTARRSGSVSVAAGSLKTTNGALQSGGADQAITVVSGKTYKLTISITGSSGITGFIRVSQRSMDVEDGTTFYYSRNAAGVGTYTAMFTASTTTAYVYCQNELGSPGSYVEWDNISLVEVLGYPALQATAANKPTLELQVNGYYWTRWDGINDFLSTSLPLGGAASQYTIITSGIVTSADASLVAAMGAAGSANRAYVGKPAGSSAVGAAAGDTWESTFNAPGFSWKSTSRVVEMVRNGTNARLLVDGVLRSTVSPTDSGASQGCYLGAANVGGSSSAPTAGGFALFCAAPSAIPDVDRILIGRFAALLSGATYT